MKIGSNRLLLSGAGLALAGLLATAGALAEKPEWAGQGGKGHQETGGEARARPGKGGPGRDAPPSKASTPVRVGGYFNEAQRPALQGYFRDQYRSGHCPPGLARKNNGCMPPGQARKWAVGQALPRDVVYYSVPPAIVVQIGAPPAGHRYVRVASDILLIAIGTQLVVDAMQDLGRM